MGTWTVRVLKCEIKKTHHLSLNGLHYSRKYFSVATAPVKQ